MSVLYFADPDDLGTPVVDLNGWTESSTSGFTLVRVEWGIDADVEFLSGGEVSGGEQVQVQHPPKQATIELTAKGDDITTLRDELYVPLAAMLNQAAVLVWQPDGYTAPFYFDTYRSGIPSMFEDADKDGHFLYTGIDISYRFQVWHNPEPRQAGVTLIDTQSISNAANVQEATNPGGSTSEGRMQITVLGSEKVVWALVGIKQGALEFVSYDIDSPEPVTDAWTLVHREVLTPTDPVAFAGRYRVVASYVGAADIFHFQCRSGSSSLGPQAFSSDEFIHDWTDVANFSQTMLDLGTVRFDAADPRLTIEIWMRSEDATDVDSWDTVYLIPADLVCMEVSSPGFQSGTYGLERYEGEDLEQEGGGDFDVTEDGAVKLVQTNQAVIVKPSDGRTLPLGRHEAEARVKIHNKDRTRRKLGELQVYDDTSLVGASSLFSRRGELVTSWDEDDRRRVAYDVTDTDEPYTEQIVYTEADDPGVFITVQRMTHDYIPAVTGGRAMVVDQGAMSAYIADDDGGNIAPLHRTSTLYLPPGDLTIAVLLGQQSPTNYDGVDARGTLPVLGSAAADLTLDVTPRHLHP